MGKNLFSIVVKFYWNIVILKEVFEGGKSIGHGDRSQDQKTFTQRSFEFFISLILGYICEKHVNIRFNQLENLARRSVAGEKLIHSITCQNAISKCHVEFIYTFVMVRNGRNSKK